MTALGIKFQCMVNTIKVNSHSPDPPMTTDPSTEDGNSTVATGQGEKNLADAKLFSLSLFISL